MEEQILKVDPSPEAPLGEDIAATVLRSVSPRQRAVTRYVDTIAGLVKDAEEGKTLPDLASALTHFLAELIVKYGAVATGHVLERLGMYISEQVERQRAVTEAEETRKEGRLAH